MKHRARMEVRRGAQLQHSPTLRQNLERLFAVGSPNTVADPVGNEEQLMNPRRKGALVDLRPAPHEVVVVEGRPMRQRQGRTNQERAFGELGNFVVSPEGEEIPGNRGSPWPRVWSEEVMW